MRIYYCDVCDKEINMESIHVGVQAVFLQVNEEGE